MSQSVKILSIAEGLSKLSVPNGGRIAILTDGGGHATVTVGALVDAGMELTTLSADTITKLRGLLPPAASFQNPVDVAGGTDDNPGRAADCAEVIKPDEGVDLLMIIGMNGGYAARFNPAPLDAEIETSHRLANLVTSSPKPLIVQSVYNAMRTAPVEVLKDAGIPVFVWCEPAVKCVAELVNYAKARHRNATSPLAACIAVVAPIWEAQAEVYGPDLLAILEKYRK